MRGGVRIAVTGALCCGLWPLLAAAADLEGVRLRSGPESTRVVLDMSGPAEHRLFSLSGPDRIVVDIADTRAVNALRLPEAKGLVTRVRTGQRANGELRVVLDLSGAAAPKSFYLAPDQPYGHRLVIDLLPPGGRDGVRRAADADGAVAGRGRDLVIAIDAGHGGRDPGTPGRNGDDEKQVVLSIARALAREFDDVPGVRPLLIRDGDYYVGHHERMAIARRAQADFFVSIHADSFRDSRARGATVYALSTQRASDEVSRRLAERENASDLIGGVTLADKDAVLARVLLDLSQNAAISASLVAGERIIDELAAVTTLRKTDVQQAPFVVLTSPDIPSILVETAYLSNPSEERALNDRSHQADLARAIRRGIVSYFGANPPPGTYMALNPPPAEPEPRQHVISRGETLSEIAERYRVSLHSLRQSNRIRGDVIRIGQVLTIPRG